MIQLQNIYLWCIFTLPIRFSPLLIPFVAILRLNPLPEVSKQFFPVFYLCKTTKKQPMSKINVCLQYK